MIVRYFHFVSIGVRPTKTYAPLVINTDAMLPLPVARKFFQAIPWGNTQIVQLFCIIVTRYQAKDWGQACKYAFIKSRERGHP